MRNKEKQKQYITRQEENISLYLHMSKILKKKVNDKIKNINTSQGRNFMRTRRKW